ncbi:MAG: hypothetical protein C0598_09455 [Marinilabiliales bacterium]|nr:MAG: hypothetical protein C0598_09455 [Marinilabiliales bacterium]
MRILSILLILLFATGLKAQDVSGCTDPQANNFDAEANINDGSCTYNPTVYKPNFRFLLPDEVEETSGLILWDGGYWTHNDSGGDNVIYKLDTLSGEVVQRVRIVNSTNVDWEDIAQDEDFIYVGDFGNNYGNRDDLSVYIIDKSDINTEEYTEVSATRISFTYEDYAGNQLKKKDNNFDCEAMIASENYIYLFSKNRGDDQSKLYKLPKVEGNYVAELVNTFNTAGLITGADLNKKTNELILVGYTNNSWIPFIWLMFDFEDEDFYSGNKRRIDMINIPATQTEGICYTANGKGVISSESNPLFNTTMYNFTTSQWIDNGASLVVSGLNANFDFNIYPNQVVCSKKLKIVFTKIPDGNYNIAVYDSMGRIVKTKDYSVDRKDEDYRLKIKTKNLKSGTYFLRVSNEKGIIEKKFIKQ